MKREQTSECLHRPPWDPQSNSSRILPGNSAQEKLFALEKFRGDKTSFPLWLSRYHKIPNTIIPDFQKASNSEIRNFKKLDLSKYEFLLFKSCRNLDLRKPGFKKIWITDFLHFGISQLQAVSQYRFLNFFIYDLLNVWKSGFLKNRIYEFSIYKNLDM